MSKKSDKRTRRDYFNDPDAPEPTSRKPSASAVVRNDSGQILMIRRADNNLWTIPTGGLKKNETMRQCAARECREETGIDINTLTLVGIFSDPGHVIAYYHGDELNEVRQPVNVCFHARPIGGSLRPAPDEATAVQWIEPAALTDLNVHPAIQRRIDHALSTPLHPLVD